MKVLAYGFEESEISNFRLRKPVAELRRQELVEIRTTADMGFPHLVPTQRLSGLTPDGWTPTREQYKGISEEVVGKSGEEQLAAARGWGMIPSFEGTSPEEAVVNSEQCKADLEWADVLFTQRYVRSAVVDGLGPMVDASGVPHILDIDDHILALDREKEVYDNYAAKAPKDWGETRVIKDPSEAKPGETVMQNQHTKQIVAVKAKQDYVRLLTEGQILGAEALICGSKQLEYVYARFRRENGKSRRVYHIPYSVDPARWENLPHPPDHAPEVWIGWMGADEHEKDLKSILPAIEEALGAYKNVRFFWKRANVLGLERLADEYPDRCIKFTQWVEHEDWPSYCALSAFDIMLAPLVSTPFNECRSPMKWIEAGMLKTPIICSKRWGYREVVDNGKTGYLADRPKEWSRALARLIESADHRREIGEATHAKAMETHNLRKNAKLYVQVFEEVAHAV